MNDQELRDRLNQTAPEVPEVFHRAMADTLGAIVAQEREHAEAPRRPAASRSLRRTLLIAALITLLLTAAAVAAYRWQVFDGIWPFDGAPQNADELMQSNLHHETVNGVEITINEAGYDGRTLYLMYSFRMPDVDTPLGSYRDGVAEEGINLEDVQLLHDRGVGWWIDQLWFDGKAMDMPGNSGGVTSGSFTPGEIIERQYWRLDNENVFLDGKVEVSLPIGECQPLEDYSLLNHPERYDEEQNLLLPDKGIVTFTMDAGDMLDRVVTEQPNIPVVTDEVTAQASEVCYSPLLTYITLKLEVNPDALAAYKAENGDGYYNDEGQLMWPYGGMDVFSDWIFSLSLVDGNGVELFPGHYGNNGYGNEWAEFIYPAIEELPDQLWLAPMDTGTADFTRAVRVK